MNSDESLKKSIDQVIDCADSENRIWDLDKLSQWRPFMKKKSREGDSDPKSCVSKNQKSASQKPKVSHSEFSWTKHGNVQFIRKKNLLNLQISVTFRSYPKAPLKPLPFKCGAYNRNRRKTTAAALHYLKMRKTRLGYKKKPITMAMLEEKARREAHIARVRETLEKQARKIQRLR